MFTINPTSRFKRLYKKLPQDIQQQCDITLQDLEDNPRHPSLRSKPYKSIPGYFESSINMNYRILWRYDETDKSIIYLIAVGDHDIL